MKLNSLRINKTYNDAHPFKVEVKVEDTASSVELILSHEAAERVVRVIAEEMQIAVREAANVVLDTFPLIENKAQTEDSDAEL